MQSTERNNLTMKTKRIISAFLTAFLALTAVSCGNTSEPQQENSSNSSSQESNESPETNEENNSEEVTESENTEDVTESEETEDETKSEDTEEETESEDTENETESEDEENSEETTIPEAFGETADINDYVKDVKEVTPPLWKVTDEETGNQIYLMGTIHLIPSSLEKYPDNIMEIYQNSDGIAVEYNVNELQENASLLTQYAMSFMYNDGTTIKDHISEETYNKAVEYFQSIGIDNITLASLDYYNTGYWINQLESVMYLRLENISLTGVDSDFISFANEDGKEIVNIETLEIQSDALNSYDDELADFVISDMVDSMDEIEDFAQEYADTYIAWAEGDDDKMLELDESDEIPDDLQDNYENYLTSMLYNRNQGMAEKASEFLKNGNNYFFMVGTGHFSGENGVDDLLADMGYTVEKIS